MSENEQEEIQQAISKGKMIIITGKCDAKVRIEGPKDKIKLIIRE